MGLDFNLNDPEVVAFNKARREKINQAMQLLQEAGYNINLTASNMSLTVICDDIKITMNEDNEPIVIIDDIDISKYLWLVNIGMMPNNFPSINVSFKTKPFIL